MITALRHNPVHHKPHQGHHQADTTLVDVASGARLATETVEKVGHDLLHAEARGVEALELAEREIVQLGGREALEIAEREVVELAEGELAANQGSKYFHKVVKTANRTATPELAETASHLSPLMAGALTVGAVGSAAISPFLIYKGVKTWHEDKLEATGAITLGLESAAASMALAGQVSHHFSGVGEIAEKALAPLAIFHGGIDIAIGSRHWAAGQKVEGALEIGFGASVIGAAVGGGIPCLVAAAGCLAGKVIHKAITA